ncbi:MAG TPA: LuxR C-terminal-related transcriptional regulator [Candidatus Saccharimonadales bacterium]|nr:LuxR C-terminal-related transcriptional regulator [Candidatus Saccharimonadales bacterium]
MADPSGVPLSDMHKRILRMMNGGKGRQQIADALDISPETVRTRVEQIKERVGVDKGADIDETLRIAHERGFLTEPVRRSEARMHGPGSRPRRRNRNT